MAKIRLLFIQFFCFAICGVVLSGCPFDKLDEVKVVFEEAIRTIDQNSKEWQTTVTKLEQDLVAQGQSTLANEVQSLANRTISTGGIELRCNIDFIGRRVNQGLRRILARLNEDPIPPLTPAYCTVDPPEIPIELIRQHRLTSLHYYGYDMFEHDASDSRMKIILRDREGKEQDISFAMALPTHYLMTVRLADDRIHFTNQTDKLIVRYDQDILSTINVIQLPPPPPPPPVLTQARVNFYTTDDNKDGDTRVTVSIDCNNRSIASVSDTWGEFKDNTDSDWKDLSVVENLEKDKIIGSHSCKATLIESPNGHDEWHFLWTLELIFSDKTVVSTPRFHGNVDYDRTTLKENL
jgi:hypothetical protein